MTMRFQTAFQVQNLPDEQNDNSFEIILPRLDLSECFDPAYTETASYVEDTNTFITRVQGSSGAAYMYTPIVEKIEFTPQGFKTEKRRIRSQYINFVVDLEEMHTATMTLFCSQNMLTQYYLEAWKNKIYNKAGEYFNPVTYYKKDIEIYFYGAGNLGVSEVSAAAHFTMKGAFPISQGKYHLEYSDKPKRLVVDVTFAFDKLVTDTTLAKKGVWTEGLSTLGMSQLDNFMTYLSSGGASTADLNQTFSNQ